MPASSTLIVYYSRTGTTKTVAEGIAQRTGADVEPLVDTIDRSGVRGFVRSIRDTLRHRGTSLRPLRADPTAYDLVIVGTPDWGKATSAPVRAFLEEHGRRLQRVAFFLTDGASDHAQVFRDMAALAGKQPVATLGLPQVDVKKSNYLDRLERFVASLPAPVMPVTTPPEGPTAHP